MYIFGLISRGHAGRRRANTKICFLYLASEVLPNYLQMHISVIKKVRYRTSVAAIGVGLGWLGLVEVGLSWVRLVEVGWVVFSPPRCWMGLCNIFGQFVLFFLGWVGGRCAYLTRLYIREKEARRLTRRIIEKVPLSVVWCCTSVFATRVGLSQVGLVGSRLRWVELGWVGLGWLGCVTPPPPLNGARRGVLRLVSLLFSWVGGRLVNFTRLSNCYPLVRERRARTLYVGKV